ncbi:MAG: LamG-like jellyroll fold domain-containing protein [Pirellulaceae bacterium]
MSSDVDQLIERYLDDRDSLSDEELSAMVDALRESEELACELKNQLLIDELIAQRMAVDRANFLAQMQQRVDDLSYGEQAVDRQVAELRDLAAAQYQQWTTTATRRPGLTRRWLAVVTIAGVLLLAALGVGYVVAKSWNSVGQIELADGSVSRIREGRTERVSAFDNVLRGDRLRTFSDGHVKIRYHDGSLIDVAADTLVEIQDEAAGAKRLLLEHGELAADVEQQPHDQRMVIGTLVAEATVLGTKLLMTAEDDDTRLDVFEGSVEMVRRADQARATVAAQQFADVASEDFKPQRIGWPSNEGGLVFLASGDYRPNLVTDPLTGQAKPCRVTPEHQARLNHDFAMEMAGGMFVASEETSETVRAACQQSGELTLEAIVRTAAVEQGGEKRIVAMSRASDDYQFHLSQVDDRLVFGLMSAIADRAAELKQVAVYQFQDEAPHHVAVTYRDGQTVCYVDGEKQFEGAMIAGDFRDWKPQPLALGDDADGGHDWAGALEGVAVYNRFMSRNEALRNSEYYHALISAREHVPQIKVHATLLGRSSVPQVEEIAPARSLLVMSRYRVESVASGKLDDREILVIEWSILNERPQSLDESKPGDLVDLVLEHVELNPQLGRYRCANDFDGKEDRDRPKYYAVRANSL